jgi:DNA polymerase III epsilon subunit-like protein
MPTNNAIRSGRFVVVDFETITPKGVPPEPIEIALAVYSFEKYPLGCPSWTSLMRPNAPFVVTPFDTAQTGITQHDVASAERSEEVLAKFDGLVAQSEASALVAQNARYELSIVRRFASVCPTLARTTFVDTVLLAKYLLPDLRSYNLDALREALGLPFQVNRHRALPDVMLTTRVFHELLQRFLASSASPSMTALVGVAGVRERPDPPMQTTLF